MFRNSNFYHFMFKCWILLKPVPVRAWTVVCTWQYRSWTGPIKPNLLHFQFCRIRLSLGILIFDHLFLNAIGSNPVGACDSYVRGSHPDRLRNADDSTAHAWNYARGEGVATNVLHSSDNKDGKSPYDVFCVFMYSPPNYHILIHRHINIYQEICFNETIHHKVQ
jgi:hypothetical protein